MPTSIECIREDVLADLVEGGWLYGGVEAMRWAAALNCRPHQWNR